jgi:hypothetical protein
MSSQVLSYPFHDISRSVDRWCEKINHHGARAILPAPRSATQLRTCGRQNTPKCCAVHIHPAQCSACARALRPSNHHH